MARKRRRKGWGLAAEGAGRATLQARYAHVKREYHRIGDALFRARHGGRSAHARKRRGKSRRSR